MDKPLMARQLTPETNLICDWDGHDPLKRTIKKGTVAYQVRGEEAIKAQGTYHSRMCYQAALEKYEELEKQMKEGEEDE